MKVVCLFLTMARLPHTVLFKTKSGITLELKNGVLYSQNIDEVVSALKQDAKSNDKFERNLALNYLLLIHRAGHAIFS